MQGEKGGVCPGEDDIYGGCRGCQGVGLLGAPKLQGEGTAASWVPRKRGKTLTTCGKGGGGFHASFAYFLPLISLLKRARRWGNLKIRGGDFKERGT